MINQIKRNTALFGVQRGFTEVMGNDIWITISGMFNMHLLHYLLGNMPHKKVSLALITFLAIRNLVENIWR
jgi:hypothetical protein